MKRIGRLMLRAAGAHAPAVRHSWRWSLASALLQACAYALFVPLVQALMADPVETARAWWLVGGFAIAVVVQGVAQAGTLQFEYRHLADVTRDLRLDIGEHLRTMPLEELDRRMSGDVSGVVGSNVTNATMGLTAIASFFFDLVAIPAFLLVLIAVIDWRLAIAAVAIVPLIAPLVRSYRAHSNQGFSDVLTVDAEVASRIVEYSQCLPVLKAAGRTGRNAELLQAAFHRQTTAMHTSQRNLTFPSIAMTSMVQAGVVGLVALGAALNLSGRLDTPTLVAVALLAFRMADPISVASLVTAIFELMDSALRRIDDVRAIPPLVRSDTPLGEPARAPDSSEVRFEGVTYTYRKAAEREGAPALRDVSLVIPARSLTALVGPSGSGKTTVTKLISRYADPQSGSVRIGGIDVRELDTTTLMAQISVVFQDVYLFDDTILANIAMARPSASEADVRAAADAANCDGFVTRFPDGYLTRVGEIGGSLSGGERQRISIARAILKDAPIVMLDEPTAALDTDSEVAVQHAIERLIEDRTVIVIAHRLSTIVNADQIVVLDDGRVVEVGRHEELLATGGRYASLWNAQERARSWRVV